MSRGLGAMQREILRAFDAILAQRPAVCTCPASSLTRWRCTACPARTGYCDRDGAQRYRESEVVSIGELQGAVARGRGAYGASFAASFSRALSSLLRRGAFVPVYDIVSPWYGHRHHVSRPKC